MTDSRSLEERLADAMAEVHLVLEQWGDGEEMHALGRSCWCEPEQTVGDWDGLPALIVDHRPAVQRDGPHGVFVVAGDAVPPPGGTLPVIGPPGG